MGFFLVLVCFVLFILVVLVVVVTVVVVVVFLLPLPVFLIHYLMAIRFPLCRNLTKTKGSSRLQALSLENKPVIKCVPDIFFVLQMQGIEGKLSATGSSNSSNGSYTQVNYKVILK